MASDIKLEIDAVDKGVKKTLKGAREETDKLTKSTDKLTTSSKKGAKAQEKATKATNQSTRSTRKWNATTFQAVQGADDFVTVLSQPGLGLVPAIRAAANNMTQLLLPFGAFAALMPAALIGTISLVKAFGDQAEVIDLVAERLKALNKITEEGIGARKKLAEILFPKEKERDPGIAAFKEQEKDIAKTETKVLKEKGVAFRQAAAKLRGLEKEEKDRDIKFDREGIARRGAAKKRSAIFQATQLREQEAIQRAEKAKGRSLTAIERREEKERLAPFTKAERGAILKPIDPFRKVTTAERITEVLRPFSVFAESFLGKKPLAEKISDQKEEVRRLKEDKEQTRKRVDIARNKRLLQFRAEQRAKAAAPRARLGVEAGKFTAAQIAAGAFPGDPLAEQELLAELAGVKADPAKAEKFRQAKAPKAGTVRGIQAQKREFAAKSAAAALQNNDLLIEGNQIMRDLLTEAKKQRANPTPIGRP